MRSLCLRLSLVAAAFFCIVTLASDVSSQAGPVSAVSYVDCRGKPRFKVGDWVKYHFKSQSDDGTKQEYDMVLLISGEEVFWGDPCFWVETQVSYGKEKPSASDSKLMSYSMFGDTLWEQRIAVYQRKSAGLAEDGSIRQELLHRSLAKRRTGRMAPVTTVLVDTLAKKEPVEVPKGTFATTKVRLKAGIGTTEDIGDSTRRTENWDMRTRYLSSQVPITSIVKEVTEQWIVWKTWKVGKSEDAVQFYPARGTATIELVAYGNGPPITPQLTPLYARKPLAKRPVVVPKMPAPSKQSAQLEK